VPVARALLEVGGRKLVMLTKNDGVTLRFECFIACQHCQRCVYSLKAVWRTSRRSARLESLLACDVFLDWRCTYALGYDSAKEEEEEEEEESVESKI